MENDINMWLANAWTAFDRLSVIWKSDLSDRIKHIFSPRSGRDHTLIRTPWTLTKRIEKKSLTIAQECYELYWTNPESKILQNSSCMATHLPSQKPFKLDEQDMRVTAREVRTNSQGTFSCRPFHTEKHVLDNQLELIYNTSVRIYDVI